MRVAARVPLHRRDKRMRLGQHYLVDPSVAAFMVEKAAIAPDDIVLEIGTGRGALTKELCKVSGRVEAFEVDRENFRATRALGLKGLALHLGDAFSEPRRFDVLVSSLPYSESSTLVEWLAQLRYDRAVLLLQKDFVKKLKSLPGDDGYRAVSMISQISSHVEPLRVVGREAFLPKPKVTSMVALIKPISVLTLEQIHLIKMIFSQKRKRLGGVLRHLGLPPPEGRAVDLNKRVEALFPEEVAELLQGGRSINGKNRISLVDRV